LLVVSRVMSLPDVGRATGERGAVVAEPLIGALAPRGRQLRTSQVHVVRAAIRHAWRCSPSRAAARTSRTLIEAGPGPSLATTRPAALFLPAGGHHQDHDAVCRAGLAAARPGGCAARPVPRLVAGYDGPEDRAWLSAGKPRPLAVDTSAAWPAKRKALECYPSQLRPAPHPRSIEKIHAQDQAAGAVIGAETAEAFAVYRMAA
jgi:hypothetical protein